MTDKDFSANLWALLTDGFWKYRQDFTYRGRPDGRVDCNLSIHWHEWDTVENIVKTAVLSPPYVDFLLWLLWIRRKFFRPIGLTIQEMMAFLHGGLALRGIDTDMMDFNETIISHLSKRGYLFSKREDRWSPGMRPGSGWTDVIDMTVKALTVIGKNCTDEERIPCIPIIDLSAYESAIDFPHKMQAATGVGVPLIIVGQESKIEAPDGTPVNVRITNVNEFEPVIYSGNLRGNLDAKNPDEKFRLFAMHKAGVSWIDMAKAAQPTLAMEIGEAEAIKIWQSEANRIQQRVTRFKKKLEKDSA